MKNESNARYTKACDSCDAEILYPDNKDNVTIDMSHPSNSTETSTYNSNSPVASDNSNRKTTHYCSHACALAHLQKITKAKAKMKKVAKANVVDKFGNVDIDITLKKVDELSEAAYISTHERSKLGEEHFLDPKRRSFPIRPGHECTDLNAALHRIGTYKGELSHDALHSKIISRMKSHGCPLPKSDK